MIAGALPSVVLIGDSICNGYSPVVRRALHGIALVDAPSEGGKTTEYTRAHLSRWLNGFAPDLVHVNCGLHDIARCPGRPPNVSMQRYRENVRATLAEIREFGAAQLWALTTPVNEAWHHARKRFDRLEADVDAYNAVAREVASDLGVAVNDLHAVVVDAGRDRILKADGAHFTEDGSRILGLAVAASIRLKLADLAPGPRRPHLTTDQG